MALLLLFTRKITFFQLFNTVDLLSYIGGVLGLCLGFSAMSCLECFYFFTIRLGLNAKMKRDEPDVSGGLFDNWNKTFFGLLFRNTKRKVKVWTEFWGKLIFDFFGWKVSHSCSLGNPFGLAIHIAFRPRNVSVLLYWSFSKRQRKSVKNNRICNF